MFGKKGHQILTSGYRLLFLSVLLIFINSFFCIKHLHGEEYDYGVDILNMRYSGYDPYALIEKQVADKEIVYRSSKEKQDEEEDTDVENETKKYLNPQKTILDNDFEEEEGEYVENDEDYEYENSYFSEKDGTSYGGGDDIGREQTEKRHYISAGVDVGTLGLGGNVSYHYRFFGVKLSGGYFKLPLNGILENLDLDLRGYNVGLLVFFRPFNGCFHLDIGFSYFFQEASGLLHTKLFSMETDLTANFRFKTGITPYIGFGWEFNIGRRFSINVDAGILITGKMQYRALFLDVENGSFKDDITDVIPYETLKKTIGEQASEIIEHLTVWPVIQVGVNYKFHL